MADQATLRRGEPALHRLPGRAGEDLAVVVGDHLFSRSLEAMLSSGLRGALQRAEQGPRRWRRAAIGAAVSAGRAVC